jgi:uncharacterized protein (TIGR03085 family)
MNNARVERALLADLLVDVGPDQPTLCEGWTTRDLAAHLVVRDRRPDAAAGIVIKKLAPHNARVQGEVAKRRWETLIDQIRHPPKLSMAGFGPTDRATNTSEFFIHLEDIRRAQPGWEPRGLTPELADALYSQLGFAAKMRLRRFPATIKINIPGYAEPLTTGAGGPELDLTGDPGELVLFLSGRQRVARVTLIGPDDLVDRLRNAKLGA